MVNKDQVVTEVKKHLAAVRAKLDQVPILQDVEVRTTAAAKKAEVSEVMCL